MRGWYEKLIVLFFIASFTVLISGCIRLFGQAGYVKRTPTEHTERVVEFDTAKAFESQQAKGSVST